MVVIMKHYHTYIDNFPISVTLYKKLLLLLEKEGAWNWDLCFQKPSMSKEKSVLSMMVTCYTSFADL